MNGTHLCSPAFHFRPNMPTEHAHNGRADAMSAPTVSSQTSSHFTLEPISADILAEDELRRRNGARALGLVRSGCRELDGYVLQGGLERGGVVGISSEDEIFGLSLGLQMLACGLCDESIQRGMVVTPKPVMSVAGELRNNLRREVLKREAETEREEGSGALEEDKCRKEKVRGCLDRVMLSQVFDVDGLWEVLAELDEPDVDDVAFRQDEEEDEETRSTDGAEKEEGGGGQLMEVKDSQDGEESPISIPGVESPGNTTTTFREEETPQQQQQHHQEENPQQKQPPGFILITHFSSLLTTLFTHREKSAAHSLLQLLSSRLRYLSRSLPSQPLIMLLNSTTASTSTAADPNATTPRKRDREGMNMNMMNRAKRAPDATLRSVFNPPEIPGVQGYVSRAAAEYLRRNKPTFGLVFSQLLDVHLLCTRGEGDGQQQSAQVLDGGELMVVEVLLDEMGVWEGRSMAPRKMREQRWGALKLVKGRIVDGVEERGKLVEDVRVVAGFGGPRV